MNYTEVGYNEFLVRVDAEPPKQYTQSEALYVFPEIPGERIVDPQGRFFFIPSTPNTNPREGEAYYDKDTRKIRVFTGSEYETVTSQ